MYDFTGILFERTASTINGVENARFFKGRIELAAGQYVSGLFLIPDVYEWPGEVAVMPNNINQVSWSNFEDYTCTLSEFRVLEGCGMVFLPAAGLRQETMFAMDSSIGSYWTITSISDNESFFLGFSDDTYPEGNLVAVTCFSGFIGASVRLISPLDYLGHHI